MEITLIAIDLAKDVFQLHGVDGQGRAVLKKKVRRAQLSATVVTLAPCVIAMEACGSAHHWAREFRAMGHEVRLIAPSFVKPFVKSNKNDRNDAQAIAEAASRPDMRFVAIKEIWQQEVQSLHRVRSRLIRDRTALVNEIRGLLSEFGVVTPKGRRQFQCSIAELISTLQAQEKLSTKSILMFQGLCTELSTLSTRIEDLEHSIAGVLKENPAMQRIEQMPGVGVLTATAMVAAVGDAKRFKNGRQFSAWLGLVPRQSSSGGKDRLLGISKRGDVYLRTLLIHGARAVLQFADRKTDKRSLWAMEKIKTRGQHRACVALANKMARSIWVMLAKEKEYQMAV